MEKNKRHKIEILKKRLHYYTFPEWSWGKEINILLFCTIGLLGSFGSICLLPVRQTFGLFAWHVGLGALMPCAKFYFSGLYRKYMDRAWDVYY